MPGDPTGSLRQEDPSEAIALERDASVAFIAPQLLKGRIILLAWYQHHPSLRRWIPKLHHPSRIESWTDCLFTVVGQSERAFNA